MSEQQVEQTEEPTELEAVLAASIAAKTVEADTEPAEIDETEVDEPSEVEVETTDVTETKAEPAETKPEKPAPVSPVTPFQACKRVNDALKAAGLNKRIQAPMLYTYANKNKFDTRPAKKVTQKGIEKEVMEIDEKSFMTWMEGYLADVIAKTTGAKKAQAPVADASNEQTEEVVAEVEQDSTPAEAE